MTISVHHWRHEDGWRDVPQVLRRINPDRPEKEFSQGMEGWHCWVYDTNMASHSFENWMKKNMTGNYDCTFRFNSGNPMYTVHITSAEDATLFKLTWL